MLLLNNIIIILYTILIHLFEIFLINRLIILILFSKIWRILRLNYFLFMRIKTHAQYIIINIFHKRMKFILLLLNRLINCMIIQSIALIIQFIFIKININIKITILCRFFIYIVYETVKILIYFLIWKYLRV